MLGTLYTPYSNFAVWVGALLVAGPVLAWATRRRWPAFGVPAVAFTLLAALVFPALWGAAASDSAARLALAPKPGYTAEEKCFTDDGHDWAVPFVHWLANTIPESDDVALKATNVSGGCMQLTLLPRRFVRASEHPRWTVLAEPLPPAVRREARRQRGLPPAQRTVTIFAPGLALLRHR